MSQYGNGSQAALGSLARLNAQAKAARSKLPDRTLEYVANLKRHYHEATVETREAGNTWYALAYQQCQEIAAATGFNVVAVAHAMAALSPLRDWDLNIRQTWEVARAVQHDRTLPRVHFKRCVTAAVECLCGNLDALSGPKVKAFAAAILGDTRAAVVDSHMLRAMGYDRTYTPKAGKPYDTVAGALTEAANQCGVPVSTFQAVVWVHIRGR
jgi:hypothetical protein